MDEWNEQDEFKGYSTVYEYDMLEDEYVRESSGYSVYEVEEGYCIEWGVDTWNSKKLNAPIDSFENGVIKLRYKFYIYYIYRIYHIRIEWEREIDLFENKVKNN